MDKKDENLIETMKVILAGVVDEKVRPIYSRLDNIDTKLHNHLEHTAMNIGGIHKDISWLKEFAMKSFNQKNGNGEKINVGQEVNIEWLKWGFRLIIATLIVNVIGFIYMFFKN